MYVNYASCLAIGVIFPVLAALSFCARVIQWRWYSTSTGIDDVLIVPAAILVIGAGVGMSLGGGMHIIGGHSPPQDQAQRVASQPEDQIKLEKFGYPFWIAHSLSLGLSKLALLFLFRRIFRGRVRRTVFDYLNWTLIFAVTLWTIAFTFAEIFMCGADFAAIWGSFYDLQHKCLNIFTLFMISSVLNFAMDLAILVLPLAMVAHLQMELTQKLQVSAVFLIGLFAVGTGLTRMVVWILVEVYMASGSTKQVLGVAPTDGQGIVSILEFWTYVEMGVSFVVACLFPCRRVFDALGVWVRSSIGSKSPTTASSSSSSAAAATEYVKEHDAAAATTTKGSMTSTRRLRSATSLDNVEMCSLEEEQEYLGPDPGVMRS